MNKKVFIEGHTNLEGDMLEAVVRKLIGEEDYDSPPYMQSNQILVIELIENE